MMQVFQVSEFIELVNGLLREAFRAEPMALEGEVSGYRVSQGQWVSFDLKDDKALVNVFMPVWNVRVPVEDGMRIRAFGVPRVYPKYGKFSFSADRVELAGEGALKKALALLRARLEKEGLFDPSRKRSLPRFPERIALIASRESAAFGDFVRVLGERWGGLEIDLYHVLVQGERAPQDLIAAIHAAQAERYDVLVMTRGGGSLEELMAFNDEGVVRAIHGSKIPTLVAVGHERDVTLAEEAADVRGSTPTDCARRLVPDRRDVHYEMTATLTRIEQAQQRRIEERHLLIQRAISVPQLWLSTQRAQLEHAASVCRSSVTQWITSLKQRLQTDRRLLASLDPRGVLARGYAIVRTASGKAVSDVAALTCGETVEVTLKTGSFDAGVERVHGASGHRRATQRRLL